MTQRSPVCAVCGKPLDYRKAVYLGWGDRCDGQPGFGWVLALCPAERPSIDGSGAPCVMEARRRLTAQGITPWPATYEDWTSPPAYFTAREAAAQLGIDVSRVRRLCEAGKMGRKINGEWRITAAEIEAARRRRPGRPARTEGD